MPEPDRPEELRIKWGMLGLPENHRPSGIDLIAAERVRQMSEKGWTAEHDDGHADGSLAMAAACYAANERIYVERRYARLVGFVDPWPWQNWEDDRKAGGNHVTRVPLRGEARKTALIKAGALIAAELDRIERREARDA
jgi:hypothetical protein